MILNGRFSQAGDDDCRRPQMIPLSECDNRSNLAVCGCVALQLRRPLERKPSDFRQARAWLFFEATVMALK